MINYPESSPVGVYVYAFVIDGVFRYIGRGVGGRYKQHATAVKSKRSVWYKHLRKSLELGRKIDVVIVADCLDTSTANELETGFIRTFGRLLLRSGPLLNTTAGGDGLDSTGATLLHSDPDFKSAHKAGCLAAHQDPTKKQRHVAAVRANAQRPEYKAKMSALSTAMHADPEFKERHSAALKAASTPERREAQKQRTTDSWQDPEIREKRLTAHTIVMQSDEYRTKQSARMKEVLANPEVRTRVADAARKTLANPEVRKKIGAQVSASYDKPGKREATSQIRAAVGARPEVKAAKSLAAKLRKEAADYFGLHYYNASKDVVQSYLQLSRRKA